MTASKAASETRLRIIRKIHRMNAGRYSSAYSFAVDLIDFIKAMDERANRRKGGLGRSKRK